MRNLISALVFISLSLSLYLVWVRQDSVGVTTIRIGHDSKISSPLHVALLEFEESIERRSSGTLLVDIYPSRQLGGVRETTEMVQQNNLQMTVGASVLLTSIVPEFNTLDVFYLFDDLEHAHTSLDHPDIGGVLLASMGDKGFHGLGFMEVGFRSLTSSERAIKSFSDLKGLKIRAASNPAQIKAWEAVSTLPTPLSWGEIFTSLQQGLINTQESSIYSIYAERFYEAQEYISLSEHTYTNYVWFMNGDFWDNLSVEHQTLIEDVARSTIEYQRELAAEQNLNILNDLKAKGMLVNEVPRNVRMQMRDNMNEAVIDILREKAGADLFDYSLERIESLKKHEGQQ